MRREPYTNGPTVLFRMLPNFPAILFLISLVRGIWYYRLLPDIVPPLIPVLWPFSVPLPRPFYLLLPLTSGAVLSISGIWARMAGRPHIKEGDKRPSEEMPSPEDSASRFHPQEGVYLGSDPAGGRRMRMERIRQVLSHPTVVSFQLQVIAVSLYAYVQETLLSPLAEETDLSSFLVYVYGGVLALSLSTFLYSVIIRMYRKNHGLS